MPLLRAAGTDLIVPGPLVFKSQDLAQTVAWLQALPGRNTGRGRGYSTMLIAMAGLPGTGKSTLAQQMAHALSGTVLDKDTIRAVLFPPALLEYTTEQDDFCMSILFQAAGYILRKDPHQHVILDGRTFSHRYQVEVVKDVAARLKTHLKIIECICSDEVARQWLRGVGTAQIKHLAGNRDYALYLAIKARFEEIDEPKLLVNTEDEPQHCLEQCLSYILETRPQ